MGIIDDLIDVSNAIEKTYLYITKCEVDGKNEEVESMKGVVQQLIVKEDRLLNEVLNNRQLSLEFNRYLMENHSMNSDPVLEMFRKDLGDNYLLKLRLLNKLYSKLIKLDKDKVALIGEMRLYIELGISSTSLNIVDDTIFTSILINNLESSSSRIKHVLLDNYITNNNDILKDDYIGFTHYKNLSFYVNSSLEYYYLNNMEVPNDVSQLIHNPNLHTSNNRKAIYDRVVTMKLANRIEYIINRLLFGTVDFKRFLCNKETLDTIYLLELHALLTLIRSDVRLETERGFNSSVNSSYHHIVKNNSLGKVKDIKKVFQVVKEVNEKELSRR